MATANLSVLSYDNNRAEVHLVYDTLSLVVSQVVGVNQSGQGVWVQVTNTQTQATFAATFPDGAGGTLAVPAGALTLTRVAQPDGSTALSTAPWSIQSRWPSA